MLVNFIYNDLNHVQRYLSDILGIEKYGDITINVNPNYQIVKKIVTRLDNFVFHHFRNANDIKEFDKRNSPNTTIIFDSSIFVIDNAEFEILLQRVVLVERNIIFPFRNRDELLYYPFFVLNNYSGSAIDLNNKQAFVKNPTYFVINSIKDTEEFILPDFLLYIDSFEEFMKLYQRQHKSRYFNQLTNVDDLIIKSSNNSEKIRKEYNYYYALPKRMQRHFVQPFDLLTDKNKSSYSMQLYQVPDVALLWIHQSLSNEHFKNFMSKIFSFLESRPIEKGNNPEGDSNYLYLTKLKDRLDNLTKLKIYKKINAILENTYDGNTVSVIADRFFKLYERYSRKITLNTLAVSHGDLCFSNILYHYESNFMKFIDPRGGDEISQLYLDEYYDLAKLSHSILGGYDFIVRGRFSIVFDDNIKITIKSPLFNSNQGQKKYFKFMIDKCGYDYTFLRLCEASLFISMLPLHADDENRIIAFLIITNNILDEVEKCIS